MLHPIVLKPAGWIHSHGIILLISNSGGDYNLNGIVEWPEVIKMPTDDLYIMENKGHLLIYSDIEQEMTITIHDSDSIEVFKQQVWNRKSKPYCINIPDLELMEGDYRVIVRFTKSPYNISGVM